MFPDWPINLCKIEAAGLYLQHCNKGNPAHQCCGAIGLKRSHQYGTDLSKQRVIRKRLFKGKEWLRSFSAGLLLLLFTFSITPRKDLHDFLANHRDTPVKAGFPGTTRLNAAGFHCNCETLVVESPFIDEIHSYELRGPGSWSCSPAVAINSMYSTPVLSACLRGPPFA